MSDTPQPQMKLFNDVEPGDTWHHAPWAALIQVRGDRARGIEPDHVTVFITAHPDEYTPISIKQAMQELRNMGYGTPTWCDPALQAHSTLPPRNQPRVRKPKPAADPVPFKFKVGQKVQHVIAGRSGAVGLILTRRLVEGDGYQYVIYEVRWDCERDGTFVAPHEIREA